jgi:hypothetical protein
MGDHDVHGEQAAQSIEAGDTRGAGLWVSKRSAGSHDSFALRLPLKSGVARGSFEQKN